MRNLSRTTLASRSREMPRMRLQLWRLPNLSGASLERMAGAQYESQSSLTCEPPEARLRGAFCRIFCVSLCLGRQMDRSRRKRATSCRQLAHLLPGKRASAKALDGSSIGSDRIDSGLFVWIGAKIWISLLLRRVSQFSLFASSLASSQKKHSSLCSPLT